MNETTNARVALRHTPLAACLGFALSMSMLPVSAVVARPIAPLAAPHASGTQRPSIHKRGADGPVAHRPATTIEVTNCADNGVGSLRDAVSQTADGDTVDLSQLTCSTITLTSGYIAIGSDITLEGPGAALLEISGNSQYGVLQHFGTGTLTIDGLTIANGKYVSNSAPLGGCIYSEGSVVVSASIVTNCVAENDSNGTVAVKGGAVYARADVELLNSTVTGSTAQSLGSANVVGGGVYAGGTFTSKYSTVSDNVANASVSGQLGYGGGVWAQGDANVMFSTVSGNQAQSLGGAVLIGSTATSPMVISESTISDNTAVASNFGGGLFVGNATSIANSTITGNTEANASNTKYGAGLTIVQGATVDLESSIIGGNDIDNSNSGLIEDDIGTRTGATATLTGADNLVNFSSVTVPSGTLSSDPNFGPLADNGGPTLTHALLAGSPAIDAGNNAGNDANDQRGSGHPRVIGAAADIGAVEYSASDDVIFADGFDG